MKPITADDLRAAILSQMEDTDRADRILEAMRPFAGKRLTVAIEAKVKEATGESKVDIHKQYGMTHLHIGGYGWSSDQDSGLSLLLAHSEVNVVVPSPEEIAERNVCYFDAAKRRNESRRAALADGAALEAMADAVNKINEGMAYFREATKYGAKFAECEYAIKPMLDRKVAGER
jgi:hypothetical protein